MLLCSPPGYCTRVCQLLIQPFCTLGVTQDVVNTFTHITSERFITRRLCVISIHTSNSISSLFIENISSAVLVMALPADFRSLPFNCYYKHSCCVDSNITMTDSFNRDANITARWLKLFKRDKNYHCLLYDHCLCGHTKHKERDG